MGFRRRNIEDPRVELTPMIDVVFLLLIFFMISTTFIEKPGLKINLPESSAQQIRQDSLEIQVYLSANGDIYLKREKISLADLLYELNSYGDRTNKMTFLLMADRDALHGKVIQLMDAAKMAGFATLAIATDKPADADKR